MTQERSEYGSAPKEFPVLLNGHKVRIDNVTGATIPQSTSLGPEGTFSEGVTLGLIGNQAKLTFVETNPEIVDAVDKKRFDMGVVAFENSIEGTVVPTLRAIIHSDLKILGERTAQIHQNIFASDEAKAKDEKIVYSHEQALAQTRRWLSRNMPGYKEERTNSTAEGVRKAKELGQFGIGDIRAGEVYNLPLYEANIEDNALNFTRFWVVGRGETEPTGNDRTWLAFTLKNEAGTLLRTLSAFSEREISINKVDTSPLAIDHYYFFVAIDGHTKDPNVAEAIEEASKNCWKLEEMGSFEKSLLTDVNYEPEAIDRGWIPDGNRQVEDEEEVVYENLIRFDLGSSSVLLDKRAADEDVMCALPEENSKDFGINGTVQKEYLKGNGSIISTVDEGRYDFGIVPFETSNEGNAAQTLRAIIHSDLSVLGERTVQAIDPKNPDNTILTRYWAVGKGETEPTGNDRTWVAFTLQNAPGSLVSVLTSFAERDISINKVDTSPLTMDHYYFFVAIDGHRKDKQVAEAIAEAKEKCWKLKVVGSFEKSVVDGIDYEPEARDRGWIPQDGGDL